MDELHQKITEIRKNYAETHPGSTKTEENEKIQEIAEEAIREKFPALLGIPLIARNSATDRRALFLYESGRFLNIAEAYNTRCEEFLSKSVKLDPSNGDAWKELGVCASKRNDKRYAVLCFQKAADLNRTAETLTHLAISLRFASTKEIPECYEKSSIRKYVIEILREATEMDPNYGPAHTALGTGLFVQFFANNSCKMELILEACEQYRMGLEAGNEEPEAALNYATALRFLDKHNEALIYFDKACKLDVRDELGSKLRLKMFTDYLIKFQGAVAKGKKDGTKKKNLLKILKAQPKPKDDDAIMMIVSAIVLHEEVCPLTLVVIDEHGESFGMTIFNSSPTFAFSIEHVLTIQRADLRHFEGCLLPRTDTYLASFYWIRISDPRLLHRNNVAVPVAAVSLQTASIEAS